MLTTHRRFFSGKRDFEPKWLTSGSDRDLSGSIREENDTPALRDPTDASTSSPRAPSCSSG